MAYNLKKSIDKKCKKLQDTTITATTTRQEDRTVIEINIDDMIEPQMRHRDIRGSKRKYDPMATYKILLKDKVLDQIDWKEASDKPIEMEIECYIEPTGTTEIEWYQCLLGWIIPTKKPDMDNIMKLVQDTFNKVLYKDDAQITKVSCSKQYNEKSSTFIRFTILEDKNLPLEKGKRCNKQIRDYYNKLLGR